MPTRPRTRLSCGVLESWQTVAEATTSYTGWHQLTMQFTLLDRELSPIGGSYRYLLTIHVACCSIRNEIYIFWREIRFPSRQINIIRQSLTLQVPSCSNRLRVWLGGWGCLTCSMTKEVGLEHPHHNKLDIFHSVHGKIGIGYLGTVHLENALFPSWMNSLKDHRSA